LIFGGLVSLQLVMSLRTILGAVHIENESVPIRLAQCRFPGLAIYNDKILLLLFFQIKYAEAILSNSTRKLLLFEITKMLIAV